MLKSIHEELIDGQTECWDAHTNQIVELVQKRYDNNDEVIKMLIDERRRINEEFKKRIRAT